MPSVETVTVLITDLVGSTGLESRIGPGAADELRDEHFALLRGALQQNAGRELKNTGDGLIAAFDSALQAVACAVSVQQRIHRRNRSAEEQLLIKVGISLGDATSSDGDYFGMPVIEAARLCERAQGGQILAKEIVAHLAGPRHGGSFRSLGDLPLKGIPNAVSTVEVGWEPLGEEGPSLPLPPRLQEVPPGGFVGRAQERERLTELFMEATEGNRRLVLISGEPGIGKTRLSTHAALEARSQQAAVLYGRCDEELAIPYRPWIEALTHYVMHGPEQVLRAHAQRHGGELNRMVAQLKERLPELPTPRETDPDTERYLLWGAVVGLLREASNEEPLVVILDDLHWADKPTLLLLKYLVSQGQGLRALVMGTYRESDLARSHPLTDALADLHGAQGIERIALMGLDEGNIVEIMERAAGHELDEAGRGLANELYRETDGNPFYAGEILRHLLESGVVYQLDGGRWTVGGELSELGLPQSMREVLGRRVERLGEEARKALSVAAVIGRDFDTDLLLPVSDRSEEQLLQLLEEAVAASVLTESASVPGRFSFAHALINHTLYADLGTTRRARLHRAIAEALEELLGDEPGVRVSELAHHWAKATTAVDRAKAVGYARLAGERALAELAPDEALRWFGQGLELQTQEAEADASERCDLLIGLGEAQRQSGEPAFRETLLEASRLASGLEDADRAARAALANNRGMVSAIGEIDAERLGALERVLELDDPPNPVRRARVLALQAQELGFEHEPSRRRALSDRALELARAAGDQRTLAEVLRNAFWAIMAPDTLELRISLARELLDSAKQAKDAALEFWAQALSMEVNIESGQLERAEAARGQLQRIAEDLGQPILSWFAQYHAAGLALMRGELVRGEQLAESALRIGSDAGEGDAILNYGAQHSHLREYQGRGEEVIGLLEQSVAAYPRIPAWRAGLARAYAWLDRRAEAAAIVEQAAADGFDHVPWDWIRLGALSLYADAASHTDLTRAARVLYELIEPWADQVVWLGPLGLGHSRTYLGLLAATLGWDERADEHLAFACEFNEAKGLATWAARAQVGWAEALASRGASEQAQKHAAHALQLSREHGFGVFEKRAATLLTTRSAATR